MKFVVGDLKKGHQKVLADETVSEKVKSGKILWGNSETRGNALLPLGGRTPLLAE